MVADRDQVQPFERVKLVDPRRYGISRSWALRDIRSTDSLALTERRQALTKAKKTDTGRSCLLGD
jgi:hypothetical protein